MKGKRLSLWCIASLSLLTAIGCGPAKKDFYATCETNEEMHVLSLADIDKQAKVDSVEALKKGHQSTKRYPIPMSKHAYGYGPNSFQYIADVMVVIVDRSVTSMELTKDAFTGDSSADEALEVSSIGGIKFALGTNLSARIEPDDSATYAYYYGVRYIVEQAGQGNPLISDQSQLAELEGFNELEKLLYQSGLIDKEKERVPYVRYVFRARPLSEVLRDDVVEYCQAKLSEKFNQATLEVGMVEKTVFFEEVFDDARAFFKEKRGVTLTVFGSTKGLQYENPLVQQIINDRFSALNAISIAEQDEFALEQTNKRMVDIAKADRDAALQFLVAYPAMRQQLEIDLRKIWAERQRILQVGWDGKLPPTVLPSSQGDSNMQFLMQLPQSN